MPCRLHCRRCHRPSGTGRSSFCKFSPDRIGPVLRMIELGSTRWLLKQGAEKALACYLLRIIWPGGDTAGISLRGPRGRAGQNWTLPLRILLHTIGEKGTSDLSIAN